ncbi:hypothetical protein VNO78_11502 [Psophocarpus tetragonolobus]|uniref:Uncharacterized protein n=1 Tax=Psophocarpus tetragonolobus TaxID=3891 RepID=A0AAN9XP07_PSOTE
MEISHARPSDLHHEVTQDDNNVAPMQVCVEFRPSDLHHEVTQDDNNVAPMQVCVEFRLNTRNLLWSELESLSDTRDTPWVIVGYFNAYTETNDKCVEDKILGSVAYPLAPFQG